MLIVDRIRRFFAYVKQQPTYGRISLALNAASLGLLVFCFLLLALSASKGFDITDTSFYLLWAGQPHNVTGAFTHFGFVTGILYDLVGESIAAFRIVELMILLSLGFVFAHAFKRYWDERFPGIGSFSLFSGVLIGLIGVLFYYWRWLYTPSYNWLALVGTLMTISGLLYAAVAVGKAPLLVAAVAMIASGGALAFIAKPTTAVVLVLMTALWVSVEVRNRRGLMLTVSSAALAALLLFVFVRTCFGSLSQYVDNVRFGLELGAALDAGHSLGEVVNQSFRQVVDFVRLWASTPFVHFFIGWLLLSSGLGGLTRSFGPRANHAMLSVTLVWLVSLVFRDLHVGATLLLVLSCLMAVFLRFILVEKSSHIGVDVRRAYLGRGVFLVFLFLLAAFAPSFGTVDPVIRHVSHSSVFLAGSIFVVLNVLTGSKYRGVFIGVYGLVLAVLLTMTLITAYDQPFRLGDDVRNQTVSVSFLNPKHHLHVDQATAAYVEGLKKTAVAAGWQVGTPLIDMTGGSPGALVILDARIVGTPWLLGGYRGSDTLARIALQSVDQAILSEAWILTAPDGRRRLDYQVLTENNLSFPDGYELVGSVTTAHRNEEQFLWKPWHDN